MGMCQDCVYWSEMIAQCIGGGPIEALCLNMASPLNSKYTTKRDGCEFCVEGPVAIDTPESKRVYANRSKT